MWCFSVALEANKSFWLLLPCFSARCPRLALSMGTGRASCHPLLLLEAVFKVVFRLPCIGRKYFCCEFGKQCRDGQSCNPLRGMNGSRFLSEGVIMFLGCRRTLLIPLSCPCTSAAAHKRSDSASSPSPCPSHRNPPPHRHAHAHHASPSALVHQPSSPCSNPAHYRYRYRSTS